MTTTEFDRYVSPTNRPVSPYVLRRLDRLVRNYDPDQPRVPAGSPDGGEFAPSGGGGSGGMTPAMTEVERLAHEASSGKDTLAKYKSTGVWDADRVRAVHDPIYARMTEGVPRAPGGRPTLYMTGGGYGSGKSTLLDKFPEHVGFPAAGKAVRADPDAIKKDIPEFRDSDPARPGPSVASLVHEESSEIAKTGVVRGLLAGKHVVYDTSGDTTPEKLEAKVMGFRKAGAVRVEAHYAFPGSVEEGQRRADYRAEHAPGVRRYVPPALLRANHEEVARVWLKSADRAVFDRLTLWSTAGKFGDPPSLIAEAEGGRTTVHDAEQFARFRALGGER